jgi:hypothetical protein
MQDALATTWKATFPGMRFLSYRITSAVPYDAAIHNKIRDDPEFFVRWEHEAGNSSAPGNGSVCQNYLSPCFNDPRRINDPDHNCSFEIRAAAYNWNHPGVGDWYLEHVLYPSLLHCDGIWLDGNGFDNGAWMCSGFCCGAKNASLAPFYTIYKLHRFTKTGSGQTQGNVQKRCVFPGFGAENSPQNQSMIDSFKAAQLVRMRLFLRRFLPHTGYVPSQARDSHQKR